MADDPLAAFTKGTPARPAIRPPALGDKRPYKAHETKQRPPKTLAVIRKNGDNEALAYTFFINARHEGTYYKAIDVIYSFYILKIRGENLRELALTIEDQTCWSIEEFDEKVHAEPEPGKPKIKRIDVVVQEVSKSLETKKSPLSPE
jgi:hypothetical protein